MPFQFDKLSVLVVEDTVPMRKLLCSALESLGVGNVTFAGDGETGFESFCKNHQDIIITDWMMEPVDGIEFTHKIRNDPSSPNRIVPIILMTGYSAITRVAEARDKGVTEFLVKPFSANDLAKRLAYVINKPRDFIDSEEYFGPDRRRRKNPDYRGPYRRESDDVDKRTASL
jgi:CheY-like chemotaxis protein